MEVHNISIVIQKLLFLEGNYSLLGILFIHLFNYSTQETGFEGIEAEVHILDRAVRLPRQHCRTLCIGWLKLTEELGNYYVDW